MAEQENFEEDLFADLYGSSLSFRVPCSCGLGPLVGTWLTIPIAMKITTSLRLDQFHSLPRQRHPQSPRLMIS
jgi:hypothetical protein